MKTTNSFRSKFFALVLALVASVSSFAKDGYPDFQVDGLYYNFLEGDSVQVTFLMPPAIPTEVAADASNKKNVSGAGYVHLTEIVIPSTVIYEDKTYHVTRIGHGAFMYCPNLMHIDLPTSIKSIGKGAFHNCRYLSSITLNEGLESIEQQAFWGCPTLKEVSLPSTLKSLKQKVFLDSKALSKVICKALFPPSVEKDLLTGTDNYNASIIPNATLYVPAESLEAYKTAAAWNTFGQILPIESTIDYKSQWCDTWNVMWFDGWRFDETASTSKYRLGKDTVIGDYTYSKFISGTFVRFTDDRKVYVYHEYFDDHDPYSEDLPTGEYLAYDFSAQVGDTLEVFSGVGTYSTYPCVVDDVQIDSETNLRTMTLHKICRIEEDGFFEEHDDMEMTWIEGVGSPEGFLISDLPCGLVGGGTYALLCAYQGDELKYTGSLYDEYGCEYNAGPFNEKLLGTWRVVGGNEIISISDSIIVFEYLGLTQKYTASATQLTVERLWIPEEEYFRWANCDYTLSNDTLWIDNFTPLLVATYPPRFGPITLVKVKNEDLFPTLCGLQRTHTVEMYDYAPNDGKRSGGYPLPFASVKDTVINGKRYLQFGDYVNGSNYSLFFLREENNKVLIYSSILQEDLVLYDYTLKLGDSLPAITSDHDYFSDDHFTKLDKAENIFTYVVTDVSTITLLDGIERKKWILKNKYLPIIEYVEGIGCYGENTSHSGDFFRLIHDHPYTTEYVGDHLVCVSKNGQLLYKMDDAEMERLGTECLCAQPGKGETDDAKDGQIGGRPTPTQWYIVEINQEVIYKLPAQRSDKEESSILSAETFIYTLENDSLRVNGKKYFNLSRYSSKESPDTKVNVGALHFENDNRVWFYHDNAEYLLYDFSAEVGDTLQLFAGIHNYPTDSVYTHVVTAKDTIEDGITRVTLDAILYEQVNGQQTELHYEKVWLAGLGSIDGIVHNSAKRASKARNNIEQNHVMLCAWREDECLYTTDHPDFMDVGCEYNHDFTAVEDIHTSGTQYQKIIRDGHLYILRDNKLYNVLGTPMN